MSAVCRWLLAFCVLGFVVSPLVAADIGGEVRTSARSGLAKPAMVQLLDGAEVIVEQYTDLDGRFQFRNVPAKTYTLRVKAQGFKDAEVPITVFNGKSEARVPVMLRPVENAEKPEDSVSEPDLVALDEMKIPRAARNEYEGALASRRRGDCAQAITRLQKAVAIYDRYGAAYNELGNCSKQTGKMEEAEAYFQKAIRFSSSIYPSINLADLYAGAGRFAEAYGLIKQAVSANPVEGDLYFALSRIYFDQGRIREAEAAGLEGHSRVHRTADVHLLLAKIYLRLENYPALQTQLETYLVESPSGPVADQVRRNLQQLSPRR